MQRTAFAAKNRAEVGAFHSAALNAGGVDNGPPGLRNLADGYPLGYYAAFVLDPDGNNLEAVFRGICTESDTCSPDCPALRRPMLMRCAPLVR